MNTTEPPAEMAPNEHDRAAPRSRLKRQSLDVSLLTTAESRVHPRTRETTRLISHGWVRIVTPFAHARDSAAPRSRLKRQSLDVSLLTRAESRVYPRSRGDRYLRSNMK